MGLRDSIIPGAFVIRGIVMMGDSSITLCSDSLVCWLMLFTNFCSSSGCGGASIAAIQLQSMRNKRLQLVVVLATAALLVSLPVSARKCWWGDIPNS